MKITSTLSADYTTRQQTEKVWHDQKFREGAELGKQRTADTVLSRFFELIGRPTGLTILDFGCGDGWLSVKLAKQGNRLYGFDISESMIDRAHQLATAANVADRTTFTVMAAEDLTYAAASFDLIIGTSILHHTDLEPTLRRIRAVLKPGGVALFLEPLNQNPALQMWRLLTPWRRTATERAFTGGDVASVRALFPETQFTYYCLTSMISAGLLLLAPKSRILSSINGRLEALDERLFATCPALGRFAAIAIMQMRH